MSSASEMRPSAVPAAPFDDVEEAALAEACNLIVADFFTYFVGAERVLVHDYTPRWPSDLRVPGLLAE